MRITVNTLKAIRHAVFPATELMVGMGIAQIIATAQVYFSNQRLFAQMAAVAETGFLPVPNPNVLPRLLDLETALGGGLFFTLSVGAGLSLLSVVAARLWLRFNSRRGCATVLLVAVLAGTVLRLNLRGFDAWTTLYVIAIPPPVFWMAAQVWLPRTAPGYRRLPTLRFLPLLLLALGWLTQYDHGLFIDLRDHVLWSNPVGAKVSSFYYRYTLYAAEVFKTFDQRLIKTVALPLETSGDCPAALARALIRLDYLPVVVTADTDLSAHVEGERLIFVHRGKVVWEEACIRFLADPRRAASEISDRADRFVFFRTLAFYGVLLAFPAALYIGLFALLRLVCSVAVDARRAEAGAAVLSLLIGFALLAYFHFSRLQPPAEAIGTAMESDCWQMRVAGLKEVRRRQADIRAVSGYAAMLTSPHPQERYWIARALSASSDPAASSDLIRLLNDPHMNVRTMALEALAQRRDPRAVKPVLRLLETSDEWYEQLYAYLALRTLQWDQTRCH
jgi:hypothetical protein